MHSSRLRTARSLTVSRSIGGGGGLGVFCPTHPDADPPGCRPPSGCRPPPRCRPPSWMQSPLPDADPPCGQTNTCENITLPQTSFSGGKKGFDLIDRTRQSFASATPSTSAINVSVCKKGSFQLQQFRSYSLD